MDSAGFTVLAALYAFLAFGTVRRAVAGSVRRGVIAIKAAQARLDLEGFRATQLGENGDVFVYLSLLLDKIERLPERHCDAIALLIFGPSTSKSLEKLRDLCSVVQMLAALPSGETLRRFAVQKIEQLGRYESILADSFMLRLLRDPGEDGVREVLLAATDRLVKHELTVYVGDLNRARSANVLIAIGVSLSVLTTLTSHRYDLVLWGAVGGFLAAIVVRPNFESGDLHVLGLLVGAPMGTLAASIALLIHEGISSVFPGIPEAGSVLRPMVLATVLGALVGSLGARFVVTSK